MLARTSSREINSETCPFQDYCYVKIKEKKPFFFFFFPFFLSSRRWVLVYLKKKEHVEGMRCDVIQYFHRESPYPAIPRTPNISALNLPATVIFSRSPRIHVEFAGIGSSLPPVDFMQHHMLSHTLPLSGKGEFSSRISTSYVEAWWSIDPNRYKLLEQTFHTSEQ